MLRLYPNGKATLHRDKGHRFKFSLPVSLYKLIEFTKENTNPPQKEKN